jgi:hypothetical protein
MDIRIRAIGTRQDVGADAHEASGLSAQAVDVSSDSESSASQVDTKLTPDAPFPPNGTSDGVDGGLVCARCSAVNPFGLHRCGTCQSWLVGNPGPTTHGFYSYKATGALPADLRVSVDEFRDSVVAAQGGLEELDAVPVRAGLCRLLVDCEVGKRLLMNQVIKCGIDSKSGQLAYDRLLATMDRWQRIAGTLGLERRSRPVVNPLDAVRRAVEEANR